MWCVIGCRGDRAAEDRVIEDLSCSDVREAEVAERYLLGALSDVERDKFELHLLECDRCGAELDTLRALRAELTASDTRTFSRRLPAGPQVWVALAAATLIVAMVVVWRLQTTADTATPKQVIPPERLAELALVDPPTYEEITLRGSNDQAARSFRSAMSAYVGGDWAAAIPELETALRLEPDAPHILFFLGVTQLLAGRPDRAIEFLDRVARSEESPFVDEGAFYLAKALLAVGRVDDARAVLGRLVESGSAFATESRALLERIDELEAQAH